ncbi:MAG: hypothetical protein JKY74_01550 [Shewanella sp.]|nr:hypothetical protein [Shewanella sp.]
MFELKDKGWIPERVRDDNKEEEESLRPFISVFPALLLAGIHSLELKGQGWIPEQESPGR